MCKGHKLLDLTDRTEYFMIHLNVKLKVKYTGLSSSLEQESAKNMNSEETTKIFSRGICTVLKEV